MGIRSECQVWVLPRWRKRMIGMVWYGMGFGITMDRVRYEFLSDLGVLPILSIIGMHKLGAC